MKITYLLSYAIITLCFVCYSCKSPKAKMSALGENIGAEVKMNDPEDIASIIAKLDKQDTVKTQLKAKVESVCQVKGCWMNLVPTAGTAEESIFVKFKDYGFFMPLDLTGSNVIVDGIAYREVTSVDELRHYAEDEGKSAEEIAAITEPEEELKFLADGVIILK